MEHDKQIKRNKYKRMFLKTLLVLAVIVIPITILLTIMANQIGLINAASIITVLALISFFMIGVVCLPAMWNEINNGKYDFSIKKNRRERK